MLPLRTTMADGSLKMGTFNPAAVPDNSCSNLPLSDSGVAISATKCSTTSKAKRGWSGGCGQIKGFLNVLSASCLCVSVQAASRGLHANAHSHTIRHLRKVIATANQLNLEINTLYCA